MVSIYGTSYYVGQRPYSQPGGVTQRVVGNDLPFQLVSAMPQLFSGGRVDGETNVGVNALGAAEPT